MGPGQGLLRFGAVEIDLDRRELRRSGCILALGARAFDLLSLLALERHRVVGKDELLEAIWPQQVVEEANLAVQVHQIRRVLGPKAVSTVAGRGYRWTLTAEGASATPVQGGEAAAGADHPNPGDDAGRPRFMAHAAPPPLAGLFGRQAECDQVLQWLAQGRQVTLTGTAGVGKSAMAAAITGRLRSAAEAGGAGRDGDPDASPSAWPGGAAFIELAAVTDAQRLLPALQAQCGGPSVEGMDPLQALLQALPERPTLLVLDNAEHLAEPVASLIDALQRRAPQLGWLVTSQRPLYRSGEQLLRLPTLGVPAEGVCDPQELLTSPAVCLFVARAQAADAGFRVTPDNAATVAAICRCLDGWPLALELAAARVHQQGLLPLQALLQQRLWGLRQVDITRATGRHAGLQAALDWSHDLLSPSERNLLADLAVFAGSFSLAAAQSVARSVIVGGRAENAPGTAPTADPWPLVDALGRLVDRALLVTLPQPDGSMRYRMPDTLRTYARAKASQDPVAAARTHARLLRWSREWAEGAQAGLWSAQQRAWYQRVDLELENLCAALEQVEDASVDDTECAERAEDALRIVCALYAYWHHRALWQPACALIERACRQAQAVPGSDALDRWLTQARIDLSMLLRRHGQHAAARAAAERAVALARGLAAHPAVGALAWRARALCALNEERLADAREDLTLARAMAEQPGCDASTRARVWFSCAELEQLEHHDDEAMALFSKVLQVRTELGQPVGVHGAHYCLAMLALRSGDLAGAQFHVLESQRAAEQADSARGRGASMVSAGLLAVGLQQWLQGVQMLTAGSARLRSSGMQLDLFEQQAIDEALRAARAAVGGPAFDGAAGAARDAPWNELQAQLQHWLWSREPWARRWGRDPLNRLPPTP